MPGMTPIRSRSLSKASWLPLVPTVAFAASDAPDWLGHAAETRLIGRSAIVPAESAAGALALPGVVILDARDAGDHENERLPGAVLVDDAAWKAWSLDGEFALQDETAWRAEATALGVDGTAPVLVIDDGSMTRAPRIWFILHRLGIRDAMIADGGLPAWRDALGDEAMTCGDVEDAGSPVASDRTAADAATASTPPAMAWLDRIDMLALLGDPRVQLVDVRSEAEFDGSRPLKNPRGGHLPGAVVLPHRELLAEDGGIVSNARIQEVLGARGIDPTRPVIVYCQSGARASFAAVALARAGVGPIACYYEGFGSWSKDERCPVVRDEIATP